MALNAWAQAPKTPAAQLAASFTDINSRVLDMAKDFPADKYDYKLRPEMRTFGAVIVHIASGNVFAAKAGRGEKAKWDELDPANYKTKAGRRRAARKIHYGRRRHAEIAAAGELSTIPFSLGSP